jgi:hypothetical protein
MEQQEALHGGVLPSSISNSSLDSQKSTECSICLSSNNTTRFHCGHRLHTQCFVDYLIYSVLHGVCTIQCPLCRNILCVIPESVYYDEAPTPPQINGTHEIVMQRNSSHTNKQSFITILKTLVMISLSYIFYYLICNSRKIL